MSLKFLQRRISAFSNVLHYALLIDPRSVPLCLLKFLFSYVFYLVAVILFVSNFSDVLKLLIRKEKEIVLKLRNELGQMKVNLNYMYLWAESLMKGIVLRGVGDKVVALFNGYSILMPSIHYASLLLEPFEKLYRVFQYTNKKVLDVGGYLGETACLFHRWGSSFITVYEPDPSKGKFVSFNLRLNGVNGYYRPKFVGGVCSGEQVDWNFVLSEKFDIAKVDCEGCERYLLDIPDELLVKIPKWVIECHSPTLLHKLLQKFSAAGFVTHIKLYHWGGKYHLISRLLKPWHEFPQLHLTLLYAEYAAASPSPV